jgi:hypothetical protein
VLPRAAVGAVDVGSGVSTEPTVWTDGTPDGNGNAGTVGMLTAGTDGTVGTFRSLGNGGTAGTVGTTAMVATASEVGAMVCVPITFPFESTVAMTSTTTVRTGGVDSAWRR